MEKQEKKPLSQRYEVGLMIVSVIIVAALVAGISIFPEKGKEVASAAMHMMTYTFGSTMQFITVIILIFLVALGFSKYGSIRLGKEKPDYKTSSWVAMMFFTGLGAGTVYWAFLEWGYHFNAAPQLEGAVVTEAYAYELSLAYAMFDWGPAAWALLCVFVLPFAYHYYVKNDKELRFSALCKYTVGDKAVKGLFGKVVDFIFIFAAIGSICITAGTSTSTVASAVADLLGISPSFALSVIILLGVSAVLQTLPFPKFAILLYLVVIILFLATTLDSCSYTLASTVSKGLKEGEEPKRGLKVVWCLLGVAIPLAITFAGTDINTIKSVVLATGLPLVIILAIIYYGFLREMKNDFGRKTRDQIIAESELPENAW